MRLLCSGLGMCMVLTVGSLLMQSVHADDWPQWLGPQRDGVWREEGILERFPEGGPKLRWSAKIEGGYAGPSVADGRVFVMDFVRAPDAKEEAFGKPGMNENWNRASLSGRERLLCLNEADGRILWTKEYPAI